MSDQREHSSGPAGSQPEEPSAGELVKQLSEQTKTLVKQEMRLAKVELQEKGKKVGIGAGMFGAGGLVAFFGAEALIVAIVLALSTALAPWLSALIVGVVLLVAAGVAAVLGKKQIQEATPPMPEQTVETVKEDVEHLKRRAKP
ncbi:MAG: phage holin family protein [Actinomycetota bacterium]|nr:phage holin family protein [Actinomycetota bacterium]